MNEELEQFLTYLDRERKASINTILSYKRAMNQLLDYLRERNIAIKNVDCTVLRKFILTLHEKNLKDSTICAKVSTMRTFFDFCMKKSWIRTNPAKLIDFPKYERPIPSFLTENEVQKFLPLPILALRDAAILELLYATGVRVSELTKLNTKDVDLKTKAILVKGKGRKNRFVFYGRRAERCLKLYLKVRRLLVEMGKREKALFLNYKGRRITSRLVERIIGKYWVLSGLSKKITPQSFRHTFAAHLLDRGAPSYFVQELLGHAGLVSTEKYFHITQKKLKKMVHPTFLWVDE